MSPGFVRFGGVAVFLALAVVVLMLVIGFASPMLLANKIVGIVIGLVLYGLIIIAYLATRGLWSSVGRRGANIPIVFLVIMMILFWVLSLFGAGMSPGGMGGMGASGGQVLGIVVLVLMVLTLVAWIWFSIYCLIAGGAAGGVWKATGILYLVGTVLAIVAAIIGFSAFVQMFAGGGAAPRGGQGAMAGAGLLGIVVGLVLLAGWICHGIGLLTGAGKMQGQR